VCVCVCVCVFDVLSWRALWFESKFVGMFVGMNRLALLGLVCHGKVKLSCIDTGTRRPGLRGAKKEKVRQGRSL
jgi:hypothetical protein